MEIHPKRFALASDHAGYRLKNSLKHWLSKRDNEISDFGTCSEESVDYPDFIRPAAEAVARGDCDLGIVFGGSGNGEAMAANRIKGVRCAVCWSKESGRLAKQHNNANMLALGQRVISEELAIDIVSSWLSARFEGGRHLVRIQKLDL